MDSRMKEIDALIKEFLTDGIITAKERSVLLKKAEKLGLDVDEIDLYIDAQQQKADMAIDAAARKKRGKTCPYCGGTIPQLEEKCPHCGELLTAEASEDLKGIIDELENALIAYKSGENTAKTKALVERYSRKAELYYGSNPKVKKLLNEVKSEAVSAEKAAKSAERKNNVINFIKSHKEIFGAVIGIICAMGLMALPAILPDENGEDTSKENTEISHDQKVIDFLEGKSIEDDTTSQKVINVTEKADDNDSEKKKEKGLFQTLKEADKKVSDAEKEFFKTVKDAIKETF
jgi:RNA polymerase subunit RPABC4/transcription elongation factor Spt4